MAEMQIDISESDDPEFSNTWTELSKSARRKILKQQHRASSHPRSPRSLAAALTSQVSARASSEPPTTSIAPLLTPPRTPNPTMQPAKKLPLLICGIGNPGAAYAHTLHSAGLAVVKALGARLAYAPFVKERGMGGGLVSRGEEQGERNWTLWQSTAYMNESGRGVAAAFKALVRAKPEARLVVVYDELERQLGSVTVRTKEGASAKGHNGLKSIMTALAGQNFARVGVGIGRPISRESEDVAAYVLRKMTEEERRKIEGCVDLVVQKLEELERG